MAWKDKEKQREYKRKEAKDRRDREKAVREAEAIAIPAAAEPEPEPALQKTAPVAVKPIKKPEAPIKVSPQTTFLEPNQKTPEGDSTFDMVEKSLLEIGENGFVVWELDKLKKIRIVLTRDDLINFHPKDLAAFTLEEMKILSGSDLKTWNYYIKAKLIEPSIKIMSRRDN